MAKIKKLLVQEVSLAAFPKNGKKFSIVKDSNQGGITMDRVLKLMAFLSTKSAEIPEVVKDELKTIAKDISTADVLDVFKELFTGYIVEQKKDGIQLVDTKKFDVLEKDSWLKKPDKEPEIPQVFKDRIEAQEKELSDLRMERFTKDITDKVGEKLVKDFLPLYGKLSKEETDKILDVFAFMKDIINELGKAQLVNGNRYAAKAADLEAKIEKYAKEHGMPVVDAYAAYAKEHPDEMAALEQ